MNFVFHRYLADRDLGSPLAAIGAMLPDLWRMADRRVRHIRLADAEPGEGPLTALDEGIRHHEQVDRWFHKTHEFRDGERATRKRMLEAAPETPRLGLFAHVAWEMCLDGALLRDVGLEGELAAMRAGLAEAQAPLDDSSALRHAVERHHFGRVRRTEAERVAFETQMGKITRGLEKGDWIGGYRDPDELAARLTGVRSRFAFPAPTPEERKRWSDAFAELEPLARASARSLVESAPGGQRRGKRVG